MNVYIKILDIYQIGFCILIRWLSYSNVFKQSSLEISRNVTQNITSVLGLLNFRTFSCVAMKSFSPRFRILSVFFSLRSRGRSRKLGASISSYNQMHLSKPRYILMSFLICKWLWIKFSKEPEAKTLEKDIEFGWEQVSNLVLKE